MDILSITTALTVMTASFHADVRLTYPDWKYKALTFSYDDAILHDRQLVDIFNRYNMKATFNVSSKRLGYKRFLPKEELAKLYAGHEIASHGENHKNMTKIPVEQQISEGKNDRIGLEKIAGYPVIGFAYPYGAYSPEVVENLKNQGFIYARTVSSTGDFRLPDNFMVWHPTAHHNAKIHEIAAKYKNYKPWGGVISLCYIWGHSYEFNDQKNWHVIENFCKELSNHPDIWYATNLEIYRYLTAYKNLKTSIDCSMLENNSAVTLYLIVNGVKVKLQPGEKLTINKRNEIRITPRPQEKPLPAPVITPEDRMIFFPDGSRKALSFSFDDGAAPDQRLAELFRKYGYSATFNMSAHALIRNPKQLEWYRGHEIATHGLRHATATLTTGTQVLHDIILDRKGLESISGQIVRGHAWPNGSTFGAPSYAQQLLKDAGIAYARGTKKQGNFALPSNFMCWEPTAKCIPEELPEWSRKFAAEPDSGDLKVCTLWGHSFELRKESDWLALEKFCVDFQNKPVWKASNIAICEYLQAVNALEWSADKSFVRNPTSATIYIGKDKKLVALKPGEILRFTPAE